MRSAGCGPAHACTTIGTGEPSAARQILLARGMDRRSRDFAVRRPRFGGRCPAAAHHVEEELRPRNLVQKTCSIVLSRTHQDVDLSEYEDDDGDDAGKWYERAEKPAEGLGEEVAVDDGALHELLPELITGSGKLISFGAGLALGAWHPAHLDGANGSLLPSPGRSSRGKVANGISSQAYRAAPGSR